MFDEYFNSEFEVATVKRHPMRSECHNFGRVLRGCPWKCLEEGRETSRVNVATVKRHLVRSECRNFGRVLRGWPRKCLEEGRETFLVNVATVKRHPVRSECRTLWGQIIHPLSVGSFRSSLAGFLWGICENVSKFRGCLAICKYFPIFAVLFGWHTSRKGLHLFIN